MQYFHSLHISFDGIVFEDYFRKAIYDSAIPIDGAYDMLSYLKEKYVLCAASNGPYAQQLHRLEIADMRKYFSYIFVSEKVGVSKPATGFLTMLSGKSISQKTACLPLIL